MKACVIFLCLFVFFACDRNRAREIKQDNSFVENGIVKQYDERNRLVAEVTFQKGVRNGVTRIYYSSGALSDEIMYVDDEKNGIAKKYHKNGNIYSLTPYVKDQKDGIQKKYYSNGKLWAETPYKKGQPGIGLKEYLLDGSLRTKFPTIEVQKFVKENKVVLNISLSNYSKHVVFYITELMEDKYIPIVVTPLNSAEGSARYEIPLPQGVSLDTTISIVAKHQTQDFNIYVSRRYYQVKVD